MGTRSRRAEAARTLMFRMTSSRWSASMAWKRRSWTSHTTSVVRSRVRVMRWGSWSSLIWTSPGFGSETALSSHIPRRPQTMPPPPVVSLFAPTARGLNEAWRGKARVRWSRSSAGFADATCCGGRFRKRGGAPSELPTERGRGRGTGRPRRCARPRCRRRRRGRRWCAPP